MNAQEGEVPTSEFCACTFYLCATTICFIAVVVMEGMLRKLPVKHGVTACLRFLQWRRRYHQLFSDGQVFCKFHSFRTLPVVDLCSRVKIDSASMV